MKYGTRIAYGVIGGAAALALTLWLGASNSEVAIVLIGILDWLPLDRTVVLNKAEAAGVFAIGSGVGTLAWLVTGREAFRCLGQRAPRAWHLWRRDALTSLIPVLKYTALGLLMGGLGAYLMQYLWGLWTTAYSAGLAAGAFGGAIYSATRSRRGSQMDFLEANQRYINDENVSVFTETEKL
ncbi:hypothetical protein [Salinibacter ruber]|uniref:hypothetical protein n=1 Tax=Salinibacter ruber TaxID=146919 RepID=UPI00160B651E|nr:hypothetical protein [Salinibacter ruber]MBB4088934.1 hypothetical protein [Salinibacter ruber]